MESVTAEAGVMMGTTAAQMQLARNNVENLQIEIGNQLLPVIKELVPGVVGVVQAISGFAEANPLARARGFLELGMPSETHAAAQPGSPERQRGDRGCNGNRRRGSPRQSPRSRSGLFVCVDGRRGLPGDNAPADRLVVKGLQVIANPLWAAATRRAEEPVKGRIEPGREQRVRMTCRRRAAPPRFGVDVLQRGDVFRMPVVGEHRHIDLRRADGSRLPVDRQDAAIVPQCVSRDELTVDDRGARCCEQRNPLAIRLHHAIEPWMLCGERRRKFARPLQPHRVVGDVVPG